MRRLYDSAIETFGQISLKDLLLVGTALVGLAALLVSSQQSWFEVPIGSGGAAIASQAEVAEPWITPFYQAAAALSALLLTASWIWRRRWTKLSITVACVWQLGSFAFPYLVMVHDPPIAAQSTWLQMQHDNLVWLGGDINTAQEFSRFGWKSHVYVVDAPRQLRVIRLPNWSTLEIGFERLPHLVEWLGYTNAFCQFATTGWYLGCFGGIAVLLSALFKNRSLDSGHIGYCVALLITMLTVYCIGAWSLPFQASRLLSDAADHTVRGRHTEALSALSAAGQTLPILCEDTYFVAQRGLLEYHLGCETPFASLCRANLLEREALYQQSLAEYRRTIEQSPAGSAVRREATRAFLRFAVHSLNSGNDERAIEQLKETLAWEPNNLKANYMLQIAYLRSGNNAELNALVDQLYELCRRLRFPTKKAILATAQQHAMYAAMLDGDINEAWLRSIKMKRP